MNYNLNQVELKPKKKKQSSFRALAKIYPYIKSEKEKLILAFTLILISSGLSLVTPILIGRVVDKYISLGQYHGVLIFGAILLAIYLVSVVTNYLQIIVMGSVGQRVLHSLRKALFSKIQSLPIAFFNQNKSGDLISRINNDTDKLNQFFSQSLMQFVGSIFTMTGAGIFLISIKPILGLTILAPALLIFIFTKIISPWVARKNLVNLNNVGNLSAEIEESLHNFQVIVAFNRRDYFREKFAKVNQATYKSGLWSGIANGVFAPVYMLASNVAQLITLIFGIYLIIHGELTVGLLISFIAYATSFYNPLRQIAAIWASFQVAMAGWERIVKVLVLENNLPQLSISVESKGSEKILEFREVSFAYAGGKQVLDKINLTLEQGKTYALVGPTGGGKTTTASLMSRLYDPSEGEIYLRGQDIRTFSESEKTESIGFILQEPFLFKGTLEENILYGNSKYENLEEGELRQILERKGLSKILERFSEGLQTNIGGHNSLSLGQRQLVAFVRAVLREPEILILDEATANVDTVTEQLLEQALNCLPRETTKIIIAHRLNTIERADQIFFVNGGQITNAGNMLEALDLLLHGELRS